MRIFIRFGQSVLVCALSLISGVHSTPADHSRPLTRREKRAADDDRDPTCGIPRRHWPNIYVIHRMSLDHDNDREQTRRMNFLRRKTHPSILQRYQFIPGVDLRSTSSRDHLKSLFLEHGWNLFPTFGDLSRLNSTDHEKKVRKKVLNRCLGYRGNESYPSGTTDDCLDITRVEYDREQTMDEVALLASHQLAWKEVAHMSDEDGPGFSVVLQDDLTFGDPYYFCAMIKSIIALPRTWDFINLKPGYKAPTVEAAPPELDKHQEFIRVRSSLQNQIYAITTDYAQYLTEANPAQYLRVVDDFTTYACDPASHPLREAFATCWPELKELRMCLVLDVFFPFEFYTPKRVPQRAQAERDKHDADNLAWLRETLSCTQELTVPGCAQELTSPWDSLTLDLENQPEDSTKAII